MASTFAQLRTKLEERVGIDNAGTTYDDARDRALNWAQEEICQVNWNFLLSTASFTMTKASTTYNLDTSFLRAGRFYCTSGTTRWELLPTNPDDILINTLTYTIGVSKPMYFALGGNYGTASVPRIYVGCYTHGYGTKALSYTFYKRIADLSAITDSSLISIVYRDDPIIAGAAFKFNIDFERRELAEKDFAEFCNSMALMCQALPYMGDNYSTILQKRGGLYGFNPQT